MYNLKKIINASINWPIVMGEMKLCSNGDQIIWNCVKKNQVTMISHKKDKNAFTNRWRFVQNYKKMLG